jgi:hypothetical protein
MSRSTKTDIQDVMQDERGRGRNPTTAEAGRSLAKKKRQASKLLRVATEEEVVEAIRGLGIRAGSPEEQKVLKIWRDNRS